MDIGNPPHRDTDTPATAFQFPIAFQFRSSEDGYGDGHGYSGAVAAVNLVVDAALEELIDSQSDRVMSGRTALKLAIGLLRVPSQAGLIRTEPLPDDVLLLLRIATGGADVAREAALTARRSPETVRRAAAFFIEQILFAPDADSYRVLGVDAHADAEELQRNAALLFQWLHPERDTHGARAAFANRLAGAWSDLKTPDRRAAYDARCRAAADPARRRANLATRSRRKQLASLLAQRRTRPYGWLASEAGSRSFFRRALARLLHRPV